jgi:asparagine synthase (glutamine-hydrolysing)
MCGITGSFGSNSQNSWVEEEVTHLVHRGPDHQGTLAFQNYLIMGSARLSMTDPLPRSNQPMLLNNGKHAITFNGEIYNFRDLRKKLICKGVEFFTDSDTEVLGQLLCHFGPLAVNELEGMYAFAFFDSENRTLILGRDSLGKKPLYWSKKDETVTWSSSLSRLGDSDVNETGLISFLAFGYTIDPYAIKNNVTAVKPGEVLIFKGDSSPHSLNLSRFPLREADLIRDDGNSGSLREKLINAVRVRIDGHSEIALSLSGGVDSAILAICLKELGVDPLCLSALWSDSDKDRYNTDAQIARKIARNLSFDFEAVDMIKSNELEVEIEKYVELMEEPNNNPSGVSMIKLYQRVADRGIRLVLTGDGADEIFAGYPRHKITSKFRLPRFHLPELLSKRVFSQPVEKRNMIDKMLLRTVHPEDAASWIYWHQLFSPTEIRNLYGSQSEKDISYILKSTIYQAAHLEMGRSTLSNLMDRDHQIWLPNESNRKLDRISMGFSIEARSPFQDENVIDHAHCFMSRNLGNQIDKVALRNAFPELEWLGIRPDKSGFISPVGHWLRGNSNYVRSKINTLTSSSFFKRGSLDRFKGAEQSGDYNRIMKLWSLLVLSCWLDLQN